MRLHGTALLLLAARAWAIEVEPVYQVRLQGGQYFFRGSQGAGEKGSLTGNVSGLAAPAVRLNDRWALLPSVSSSYQGTKQVVDLVGAGSIFQEAMDHRAGVKAVYGPPEGAWRIKPNVGFRAQLLKETKDEDWGSGLFDYQRANAGLELEYVYHEPFEARVAADFYRTTFPNYASLESKAGTDPNGGALARELAGANVLDNDAVSALAGINAPILPVGSVVDGTYAFQRIAYPHQHIVDETGGLAPARRQDFVNSLMGSVKVPRELTPDLRLAGVLGVGVSYYTSNQNSYDARRTRFMDRFYNYGELRAGPGLTLSFGDPEAPITAGLSGTWAYRRYPYRPIQDSAGSYLGTSLWQHSWMLSTSLTYPMAPRFSLVFNLQYGKSHSNMRYEQFYAYNYSATNYVFGFAYDY